MEFDKIPPSDGATDRRVASEVGEEIGTAEEGEEEELTEEQMTTPEEALGKPLASSLPGQVPSQTKRPYTDREVTKLIDKARGIILTEGGYGLTTNKRGYLTMHVRGGNSRSLGRYDERVERGIKELMSPSTERIMMMTDDPSSRPSKVEVQAAKAQNLKLFEHKVGGQKGTTVPLLDSVVKNTTWAMDATYKIGRIAEYVVLNTKGIIDTDIVSAVDQFASSDEYVSVIREGLVTLARASQDAAYIGELERKLRAETAKEAYLEFILKQVQGDRDEILFKYRLATSTMCERDLRALAEKDVFRRVTDQVSSQPQSLFQQAPHNGSKEIER